MSSGDFMPPAQKQADFIRKYYSEVELVDSKDVNVTLNLRIAYD